MSEAAGVPTPRHAKPGQSVGSGIGSSGAARFTAQIIQFASSIVLARLLVPDDYGILAVILTVSAFALLLNDFGLVETLIGWRDLTMLQVNSAFILNATTGVVLFGASVAVSPLLASIFGQPRLTYLFPLAAIVFITNTNTVQIGILQRNRCYGALALVDFSNAFVNALVSITAAALGLGALSLVLGVVSGSIIATSLLWREIRWIPGWSSVAAIRDMARASVGNMSYLIATYVGGAADTYAIGATATSATLGVYNRGFNLARIPSLLVGGVLSRVLLPIYASLRDSGDELRSAWRYYASLTLIVLIPLAAMMSAAANDMILVLYGPRWERSAAFLGILSWSIPAFALTSTLLPCMYVLARQRLIFFVGLAQSATIVSLVAVGAVFGVRGVAVSVVIGAYAGPFFAISSTMRLMGLRMAELFQRLLKPLIVGGLVYLIVKPGFGIDEPVPRLLVDGAAALFVWLVAASSMEASVRDLFRQLGQRALKSGPNPG